MHYNAQPGRSETQSINVKAMANELLIIQEPAPKQNKIRKINDIRETWYARVIAVGEPQGRYRRAPVEVGDVVVTQTATAGIHHNNKASASPGVASDHGRSRGLRP